MIRTPSPPCTTARCCLWCRSAGRHRRPRPRSPRRFSSRSGTGPRFDPTQARTWVPTIAHRRAVDGSQRTGASAPSGPERRMPPEHSRGRRTSPSTSTIGARAVERMTALPSVQREVLAFYDGLTHVQIAERLDVALDGQDPVERADPAPLHHRGQPMNHDRNDDDLRGAARLLAAVDAFLTPTSRPRSSTLAGVVRTSSAPNSRRCARRRRPSPRPQPLRLRRRCGRTCSPPSPTNRSSPPRRRSRARRPPTLRTTSCRCGPLGAGAGRRRSAPRSVAVAFLVVAPGSGSDQLRRRCRRRGR